MLNFIPRLFMKPSLLLATLALAAAADTVYVQVPAPTPAATPALTYPGYHRHDGFYLSVNIGPALGGTLLSASGSSAPVNELAYRGPGALLDFKIGGAIRENLILSFDVIGRTISGPDIEADGENYTSTDDLRTIDNSYSIGLTRYFMPHNMFVSGSVGFARMVIQDDASNSQGKSEWGLGLHLKGGKEWWVGKNWGLGVSGGYGFSIAKDQAPSGADYDGTLTSHQFYLLFNTTYN